VTIPSELPVVELPGVNVPVAPVGNPDTLKPTLPANPPDGVTFTASEPPCPATTLSVGVAVDKLKD
jgi:hypothetical protein